MTQGFQPAISSLLDTDLYKFTMWQVMLHQNPEATGVTEFMMPQHAALPVGATGRRGAPTTRVAVQPTLHRKRRAAPRHAQLLQERLPGVAGHLPLQMKFLDISTAGDALKITAHGPLVASLPSRSSFCRSSTNCISGA